MKKIFFILFWFFIQIFWVFASSNASSSKIKDWILNSLPWHDKVISNSEAWKDSLTSLLLYWKNTIFDLLALIAVWVFLYIWYKIIMAKWKPEEFKKAFMHLVYAIVWIVIISLAWVIIVFVAGLKF